MTDEDEVQQGQRELMEDVREGDVVEADQTQEEEPTPQQDEE